MQDGIAFDTETKLMWLRFVYGQNWEKNTAVGKIKTLDWYKAHAAEKLFNLHGGYGGYIDWRLPTSDELKTLIDESKKLSNAVNGTNEIPVNTDVFHGFKSKYFWINDITRYWSSSDGAQDSGSAWAVHFNLTNDFSNFKSRSHAVRLVRSF